MVDLDRIKAKISDIAHRRTSVTIAEIKWVVSQLGQLEGCEVSLRPTGKGGHSVLFRVKVGGESQRFNVATHNPGSKEIKPVYVDEFVDAMIELGLHED